MKDARTKPSTIQKAAAATDVEAARMAALCPEGALALACGDMNEDGRAAPEKQRHHHERRAGHEGGDVEEIGGMQVIVPCDARGCERDDAVVMDRQPAEQGNEHERRRPARERAPAVDRQEN